MVRRSGSRVVVTRKDDVLLEVPAHRLQGVLIYGNIQMSTQCMRTLLAEEVWVTFLSRNGQYRGRLQPPAERGGRLRRRQWERAADPAFCLSFAKTVVRGKIIAATQVADAYAKNRAAESLGTARSRLRECLARVSDTPDLVTLRGVEGAAARAYFDLFGRWNSSDFVFPGREKRGTANPLNALLNFGYTLVTRELEGLLEAAGLDPTVGFYHQPDDDRPSLACDWVEEFRHLIVDRLVLTLVNRRSLTGEHFETGEDHRGVRMKSEGLRIFSAAYDKAMRRSCSNDDEPGAAAAGVRATMLTQLARLLDALAGRADYVNHLEVAATGMSPSCVAATPEVSPLEGGSVASPAAGS
jgi:CRISPR-associated protein Cas1